MLGFKKDVTFSTHESRRMTEVDRHITKQEFRYDINDFLPSECDDQFTLRYDNYQINTQYQHYSGPSSVEASRLATQMSQNEKQKIRNEWEDLLKGKDEEIEGLRKQIALIENKKEQFEKKAQNLEIYVQRLNSEISEKINRQKAIVEKESQSIEQVRLLEEKIVGLQRDNRSLKDTILEWKKEGEKKTKNIRIFSHKYQFNFEPKHKQLYNVYIQTDQVSTKLQSSFVAEQLLRQSSSKKKREAQPAYQQIQVNKKSGSNSKQFYRLYQQHKPIEDGKGINLNSQVTSKSQIMGSQGKPRKPSIIQNISNLGELGKGRQNKQNDRKRLNQRIDGVGNGQKERQKYKTKNEQIEIYPIDESEIESIVYGLLAMK